MTLLAPAAEVLLQETIDKFWESVPPVWNRIRCNVRGIAAERFDITIEQFHVLRHIRKGIQSVSELAEARQISRPGVSQAVDLLVEKGLVTRRQSAEDRRYVRLELTEEGNTLLNTIFQQNRAWMLEKLASLSAEEAQSVIAGLAVLKKIFIDEPDA